jgi:hypothetical protein
MATIAAIEMGPAIEMATGPFSCSNEIQSRRGMHASLPARPILATLITHIVGHWAELQLVDRSK